MPPEDPRSVAWLVPTNVPPGLRLIVARRELTGECHGAADDCAATAASAQLRYESTDWRVTRTLSMGELRPTTPPDLADPIETAPVRPAGPRTVHVIAGRAGPGNQIEARWNEPTGIAVQISATGLSWDVVAAYIGALAANDPASFTEVDVPPSNEPCVGPTLQMAPTPTPDGWNRFVLDARPTGSCGTGLLLMMSFVLPGTIDQPGTLVTIVTQPATDSTPASMTGEPATVGPYRATVETSRLYVLAGDVVVDIHGNATTEQLRAIAETIRPLDDAEWAELVAAIDHG